MCCFFHSISNAAKLAVQRVTDMKITKQIYAWQQYLEENRKADGNLKGFLRSVPLFFRTFIERQEKGNCVVTILIG